MSAKSRWLHRYAVLTACATFCLLIAGGLVTSTDSGLAVPDWPLSYGTWNPPMVGGILFEHGHRMIAGAVGLLILGLAVWTGRAEPRRWVRRLGYAALGAVIVQALLGGATVLLLLPPQISISHAMLGQGTFCLTVALAWALGGRWPRDPGTSTTRFQSAALGTAVLAALQLFLGAVIRHTGHAVHPHMAVAAALVIAAAVTARQAWMVRGTLPAAWRFSARLLALLAVQVGLGLWVFFHRGSVPFRTAHVVCGALALAQAVMLAWLALRSSASDARRPSLFTWNDLMQLTKARLSMLVLMSTAVGYWLGMPDEVSWPHLLWACAGTWLVVAGANALNQWLERDADARMDRTKSRPVAAGRMAPRDAFAAGAVMSAAGAGVLAALVNPLSAWLAAASWASYVLVYTPLKRITPLSTLVGAIPGALPPVIGWAAASGSLDHGAWALFGIIFLWQLPHFLAIAILYRDDYARGGFPMLPVIEANGLITARQILFYGAALLPISLLPAVVGVSGRSYFYGALVLSAAFLAVAARAAWLRSPRSARQLFHASIVYLPVLLGLLAIDRIRL